jgi:hypothetical protein
MIPGTYNLTIVENSQNTVSFSIAGITTASGYSAAIDIRVGDAANGTLLLGLTSPSSGIAVSSDGSSLTVAVTITEAQADTMAPTIRSGGAFWSLKVTAPGTITTQYLLGAVKVIRTPTA